MRARLAWLTVTAILTAACVAPAPIRGPEDLDFAVPEGWTAGATVDEGSSQGESWWAGFADPALDELILTAWERNHDLQVAAARIEQAEALARIAGADLKPRLEVGLSGARRRQNFIGLPIPGTGGVLSTTSSTVGASITGSWEADLWGRLRARNRAALADAQAAAQEFEAARLSIAAQTAKAWFSVAEATQQVELARKSADSFQKLAEQIRDRYERGVRPAIDLRLALSNHASAEAQVQRRQRELDAATRRLEVLVGRYPAAALLEEQAPTVMSTPPGPVPAMLPSELIARRPDLRSAERRLAAADQRLVAARRELYPRFSLTASGGTASDQLADLLDGDFRVWSWLANLTQPLFQGGRLRAGVDRAEATVDENEARFAGAVLRAYAEVETALAAETLLAEQQRHVETSSTQLIAAEQLARERYRSGVGGYLNVLDAQTRSFAAQSNVIALRRARLDNRVDLHLALAGGFDPPPAGSAGPDPGAPHPAADSTRDATGAMPASVGSDAP